MNNQPPDTIELSTAGAQRRAAIRDTLVGRARARRSGRRMLAAIASLGLLAGGAFLAMSIMTPLPTRPIELADDTSTVPALGPAFAEPVAPAKRITVVANEPITDRPCGASDRAGSTGVSICILSDAELLSALSTTGESYGLVRIGGRARVVSNSAR